ncbi:MAG: dihydrolipoyl dehydrogenase [Ignavibacteria bacterium]|nr:dihydrolipoyl dehydrogenase [Ignavibacteria bacterium]
MNKHTADVVVIGSGPGGYVAAVRASQLGLKTICVEKSELGGVCLNWGCIPTKALLKSAEYAHFIKEAQNFGFNINDYSVDFENVIKRSREVANRMSNGVSFLFKKYKVQLIKGWGKFKDKNIIEVFDENGNVTDVINSNHTIIATGARPRMFPGIEVDGEKILTSKEAMVLKEIPKEIVIMGAGAIGVEFAYFFSSFGSKVTLVEMMDRILPVEDEEISKELERHFKKDGIKILTKTKVISAKVIDSKVEIVVSKDGGKEETLTSDYALNAIGIQANLENIGLESLGVKIEKGFIKVDEFMRTNIEGIYAIGDVAGPPWLAHKASAEGIVAVEKIAGLNPHPIDYKNIPGCTYCQPQVASVGLTEKEAKEAGFDIRIGKFPYTANGKAHGIGEARGFVKLVIDNKYGEILGAHLIGPDVTEMVAELTLARNLEATAHSLIKTIHPHPTLSEAIMEAAAVAYNESPNI